MTARAVVCDPERGDGSPCIQGTELTCATVMALLLGPRGLDGVRETGGGLTVEDVLACVRYCADQQCLRDSPEHFCEGCMLDDRIDIHGGPGPGISGLGQLAEDRESPALSASLGGGDYYDGSARPREVWLAAARWLEDTGPRD